MQGPGPKEGQALVLTLHGAGVEGQGQADAYASKNWCHIVAATNRRPYGFDWEDWGRLDAMEVLENAQKELKTDPSRTYLTGHSMGGHGTWHVGVTFPDRFAAIAPSAGWVSFWSYAGGRRVESPTGVEELLQRAGNASDTLGLMRNYAQHGIYVLHGDADDNVPVNQARTMRQHLGTFHPDFVYYERPGAGHWWGNACVDWPPLFEFLNQRRLPPREQINKVEFITASPGVSAACHWARIEMQHEPAKFSSIKLTQDPKKPSFSGTTDNVELLSLDLGHLKPAESVQVELDGQKLDKLAWPAEGQRLWLKRDLGKTWFAIAGPKPNWKSPARSGPFKDAFRNRMVFVHGTLGTPEENAWSLARARFDAETFWYRGNGSVDIVSDQLFDPKTEPNRNVILYGNAATNSAWKPLLEKSPVQVERGKLRIGDKELVGDDLAYLFIRPRPDSATASVGVVSGTGLPGLKLTERMPYWVSGAAFPDCLVVGPEMLTEGVKGVRVAGFFGNDWGVGTGDFVGLKNE
jgi:predicted esterase